MVYFCLSWLYIAAGYLDGVLGLTVVLLVVLVVFEAIACVLVYDVEELVVVVLGGVGFLCAEYLVGYLYEGAYVAGYLLLECDFDHWLSIIFGGIKYFMPVF